MRGRRASYPSSIRVGIGFPRPLIDKRYRNDSRSGRRSRVWHLLPEENRK